MPTFAMKLFTRSKERTRSKDELFDEISELTRQNREQRDLERDRRILRLRHLAGIELVREAAAIRSSSSRISTPFNRTTRR